MKVLFPNLDKIVYFDTEYNFCTKSNKGAMSREKGGIIPSNQGPTWVTGYSKAY